MDPEENLLVENGAAWRRMGTCSSAYPRRVDYG
jgi:hypothetical protein